MAFRIRFTEAAVADLEAILYYSWAKFPATTERFAEAILAHVQSLEDFPYVGRLVRARPGVRELVHTPVIVEYRVIEEEHVVQILAFRHASRER
jgi:plasmid stabilization system protein ParE